jgi:hypothetical protein
MFRLLGTPNETVWPGVSSLPHFSPAFPKWPAQRLTKRVRGLEGDDSALELLQVRRARRRGVRTCDSASLGHALLTCFVDRALVRASACAHAYASTGDAHNGP